MEIDKLKNKLNDRTPLSMLSWDKYHKVCLINDRKHKACNWDALTEKVCATLRGGQSASSCDAYLETNGVHYFIEFKNEPSKNVDRQEIWRKAYDSIATMRMAVNQAIALDDLCRNTILLVVFQDEEQKGLDAFKQKTAGFAKEEYPVYWELRSIAGKLYREVHTIPVTEFRETWIPRIWGGEI